MTLPDVHCHVDKLLEVSPEAGLLDELGQTIAVTTNWTSYLRTSLLGMGRKNLHVSLGLHPDLTFLRIEDVPLVVSQIPKVRFIGEIGLDFSGSRGRMARRHQEIIFRMLLRECEKGDKILNIHSRGAENRAIEILDSYDIDRIILHWYLGPTRPAKVAMDNGWYFSIPPVVDKSKKIQRLAAAVNEELLLLESDAPYGTRCDQSIQTILRTSAARVAEIRRVPASTIRGIVRENFLRLVSPAGGLDGQTTIPVKLDSF